MNSETRRNERFDDIGRIESSEICPFPGVLDNVSRTGCKVHYQFPVTIDLDNDYELKITFARAASEGSLLLMCHPQWVKEESGLTEIGFQILPSKDSARLAEYTEKLDLDQNDEDLGDMISDSGAQII